MWKALVLLAAACAGIWYYAVDGRKLDEHMVREFYEQQQRATYNRDPEALCKQYAKKLVVHVESVRGGQSTTLALGQKEACEKLRETFRFFEDAGEKAGGILTIEYTYELRNIELSGDRKSATVEVSNTLKMGESFMQFFTTSTERLERSMREVQLVRVDAKTSMRWTPGALAHPEKFEAR